MVYYTGDTHGKFGKIIDFIVKEKLTYRDTIVILGDVGFNYYGNKYGDAQRKAKVDSYGVRIFCIQGNHENRPTNIPTYLEGTAYGGSVCYEPDYPNLLFANDGEIYDLDGRKSIVIGGAYSVDKQYRLMQGYKWFEDEQPSAEIKSRVEQVLEENNWCIDQVLTHTCPTKYVPVEKYMPTIDQSTVDTSTEEWLDKIEDKLKYNRWLCGHWHTDKSIDLMRFLMDDFVI